MKDDIFIRNKETSDCSGSSQAVLDHSFGKRRIMLKATYNIRM